MQEEDSFFNVAFYWVSVIVVSALLALTIIHFYPRSRNASHEQIAKSPPSESIDALIARERSHLSETAVKESAVEKKRQADSSGNASADQTPLLGDTVADFESCYGPSSRTGSSTGDAVSVATDWKVYDQPKSGLKLAAWFSRGRAVRLEYRGVLSSFNGKADSIYNRNMEGLSWSSSPITINGNNNNGYGDFYTDEGDCSRIQLLPDGNNAEAEVRLTLASPDYFNADQVALNISLFHGTTLHESPSSVLNKLQSAISSTTTKACDACNGSGRVNSKCSKCNGSNRVLVTLTQNGFKKCWSCGAPCKSKPEASGWWCISCGRSWTPTFKKWVPCEACQNTGGQEEVCSACSGTGKMQVGQYAQNKAASFPQTTMGHKAPWGKPGGKIIAVYSTAKEAVSAKASKIRAANAVMDGLSEQVINGGNASMSVQRPPEYIIEPVQDGYALIELLITR